MHQNVPGILSKINRLLSESGINIVSQYLQTNENVGYVVVDIDAEYSDVALRQLREIEGTVRCRVLF